MALFPLKTDYGLVRVTAFKVLKKDLGNGYEQRVLKSTGPLHRYRLVFKERLTADMKAGLYDFYVARRGSFEAFDLDDPTTVPPTRRKVRFVEDELEEEFFYTLLENAQIEVMEVM